MRDALDGISEYDPQVLVDQNLDPTSYTGNARFSQGFFDRAAELGHPVAWMIQETYSTRSQEGYEAGVYDCRFAEQRARERGWTGAISYVVSDGWGGDVWSSFEYARGIGDVATVDYYVFAYGANGVINDFAPGVRASSGGAQRLFLGTDGDMARWVPETWPGGNNAVGQVVGYSPVADTDLNHVYVEFGTPPPPPPPPPTPIIKQKVENKMWCAVIIHDSDGSVMNAVDVWYDGVLVESFRQENTNMFNVGPRLQSHLDRGAGMSTYLERADYEKVRTALNAH